MELTVDISPLPALKCSLKYGKKTPKLERYICDLISNHLASLIIETYALIIIVITLMIMIITSQESRRGLLKSAGEPVKMITCT